MFKILEIVIGLVFVYLLLSLLASVIQELIGRFLKWSSRGGNLEAAIGEMLGADFSKKFYAHPLMQVFSGISGSKKPSPVDSRRPSYLSSSTFAAIIIELLDKTKIVDPDWKQVECQINKEITDPAARAIILYYLQEADKNLDVFRAGLEQWYNECMERLLGVYKRKTQVFLVIIGFCISVAFNADTFIIIEKLSADDAARLTILEKASTFLKDSTIKVDSLTQKNDSLLVAEARGIITGDLQDVNGVLGLGWNVDKAKNFREKLEFVGRSIGFRKVLGWLATALAISLGAPFWFDMLSKVINVRNAGKTLSASVMPNSPLPSNGSSLSISSSSTPPPAVG